MAMRHEPVGLRADGSGMDGRGEPELQRLTIDTIRGLAMDAVQKADAGHPGTAMALAPLGYMLFKRVLRATPATRGWQDRDRFVLSAGHACVLLYSLLHLSGYELSLEDLKQFRQWGSRTPGHPERGHTPGVEVTTGPLGQGFANAVGMAMSERFLAERYNRPGEEVVDHHTYAICSDGDMMEGVSQEAASIAGHFGLGRLTVCYDDNRITIDGSTAISFDGENHIARLAADGWHVQRVGDSEDIEALTAALAAARAETERPSFIAVRSHIAYPAPHAVDTAAAHGAPLGEEEVRAAKLAMGFDPERDFWVDERVYGHMSLADAGAEAEREWQARLDAWREAHPALAEDWERAWAGRLAEGWREALPSFAAGEKLATRAAGQKTMAAFSAYAPTMLGGAADLVESTKTVFPGTGHFSQGAHGPQRPVRDPRARDGGDRQWRGGARGDRQAVRLDVPDLLRLHARVGAPLGADGSGSGVGVDARLGGARRGRPHSPAGRALRLAARDPAPVGDPPSGRQRDRARVAGGAGARGRPGGAAALPPGDPGAGPRGREAGGGLRAGARRIRAVGLRRRTPGGDPDLHRRRGPAHAGGRRVLAGEGRRCGWCRCRAWSCSKPSRRSTATRCSRPRSPPAWRSSRGRA